MIAAIWIVTLLLAALWSLGAWGLASLLATDGAWIEQVEPWLARAPFGPWLETWIPDWLQLAQALLDLTQHLLAWLGGAAPVLVWVLWAVGVAALLLLAGVLTLVVALVQRSTPPAQPPAAAQA